MTPAQLRSLARRYKCSVQTVRNWLKAGAPLHSKPAMAEWLDSRHVANDELEPGDLKAAKLAKLKAETKRILFKLETERGGYTANDETTRIATVWAAQVRAELMSLLSEAPTWAGLDAPTLQDRAKSFVNGALGRLSTFHA